MARLDRTIRGGKLHPMRKLLILCGAALVAAGLLWPFLSRLGLGRLPGDITIRTEHGGLYFPIATCILVSMVLSLIFWLFNR